MSDIETSIRFYRDEMGLPLTGRHAGFPFLETGSATLTLSTERIAQAPAAAGATEVVFAVDGVREAYAELMARNVCFSTEPHPLTGPHWVAHLHDPDGHRLSLVGPEHKSQ